MQEIPSTRQGYPPPICGGGQAMAKSTFQPIERKCKIASYALTSLISPFSSLVGCNMIAFFICWPQEICSSLFIFLSKLCSACYYLAALASFTSSMRQTSRLLIFTPAGNAL
jgi:hypothetical protein